jgi:sulfide:quinone oxidoreductase
MTRITIVGSGFAALTAIQALRRVAAESDITLVSPKAEFVYYPGLIWVPTGLRSGEDLQIPLQSFFRRMRVNHLSAKAKGLRDGGRVLETTAGDIENDGLVICSGGRYMKKLPGIEHAILPCEGVAAAQRIRDRLRAMDGGTIAMGFSGNPKEPAAMRGGPMFEFLFGTDSHLRKQRRRDRFELVFFTPAEKPGNRLGPKAVAGLTEEMRKRDIRTHLGHKLKGFMPNKVMTEGGEFDADLILFMPGMTGSLWFDSTGSTSPGIRAAFRDPSGCRSRPTWQTCRRKRRSPAWRRSSRASNRVSPSASSFSASSMPTTEECWWPAMRSTIWCCPPCACSTG